MATRGEAGSYYDEGGDESQGKQGYPMQPQMQYPPPTLNPGYGNAGPQYQQPPPNYGQNFQSSGAPPTTGADGKQTFDQAFKLEKPKYNDLWAGILVCLMQQALNCPRLTRSS